MRFACIASGSEQSRLCQEQLSAKHEFVDAEEADVIIALGGDGLMLHGMHKFLAAGKPIYGLNCGTVGFLMNRIEGERDLAERVASAEETHVYPLKMTAKTTDGQQHEMLAFNEVSVIRYSNQTANLQLTINGVVRIPKLVCDGILVSTPMGSTAYNLSAHGPILPIGSNVLALTPVSPFRPRRWHGALLPREAVVELTNLDPSKRPLGASADFHEVRDVVSLVVEEDRSQPFRILFDTDHSLEERIFSEQFTN